MCVSAALSPLKKMGTTESFLHYSLHVCYDPAGLPPLKHLDVPKFNYSFSMRVKQLLVVCSTVALFLAVMAASVKLVLLLMAGMGDLQGKVCKEAEKKHS